MSYQRYFAVIQGVLNLIGEVIQKTPPFWIASGFTLTMTMHRVAVDTKVGSFNKQQEQDFKVVVGNIKHNNNFRFGADKVGANTLLA